MNPAVLIVEDDPVNMLTLDGMLSADTYDVLQATSAEEAIDVLSHFKVDVIVLDNMLPGMNGVDLAKALKKYKDTRSIPVVLVTGSVGGGVVVGAMSAYVVDLLQKPVGRERLLYALERALEDRP